MQRTWAAFTMQLYPAVASQNMQRPFCSCQSGSQVCSCHDAQSSLQCPFPCLLLQAKSAYMYFVQDKLKEIKASAPGPICNQSQFCCTCERQCMAIAPTTRLRAALCMMCRMPSKDVCTIV